VQGHRNRALVVELEGHLRLKPLKIFLWV
jgi:hypothetical protein